MVDLKLKAKTIGLVIDYIKAESPLSIEDLLEKLGNIQKEKEILGEQKEMAKPSVEFEVSQHQYKAGKAWVQRATENWGTTGNFLSPFDVVKDGYITTKHFRLTDGRFLAETIGSKSHAKRIRLQILNGEIVKEESISV